MKAKVGDDALDAAGADGKTCLAEFLGDDVGGDVGIEKALTNDLADGLIGAFGGRFGAALLTEESLAALGLESIAELEVALFGEAEFACGFKWSALAFAFEDHEEFTGDFVVGGDGKRASGADDSSSPSRHDRFVRLWNLEFGRELRRFDIKELWVPW